MPVLWICGTPGVGKSVTAWELFTSRTLARARVSYLYIDQLGMLYPESEDDPEGSALRQRALTAVRHNYSRANGGFLVVSGIIDPTCLVEDTHTCLLTAEPRVLRQRIRERGWTTEDADDVVAEQEALVAADLADEVVDTTGLSVADVAARVRASFLDAPGGTAPTSEAPRHPAGHEPILLVNGPRGVGCSTVSFGLAQRRWRSEVLTGFLDLGQLSFARTPEREDRANLVLGLSNVATMREVFSAHGAKEVIVNGHLTTADELRRFRQRESATVVRLRADPETIAGHLLERRGGNDARLTGDDLATASAAHRAAILSVAVEQQEQLDELGEEDLVVDVSGRTADEVLDEITARLDDT